MSTAHRSVTLDRVQREAVRSEIALVSDFVEPDRHLDALGALRQIAAVRPKVSA